MIVWQQVYDEMKHEVGNQCTCDMCKDWKTYGKWFSQWFVNKDGQVCYSSTHYPPESFMTKKERIDYMEQIKKNMAENPEKYPFGNVL